ncbi:MAG: thioredoxin family protein [Prevotella sp.]|nr:thioredoxin family protein [Prevotella sp.]
MNKKTIITTLLALVTMAGQGQVKSGLDLCLRDETTGEWLIGLFDEYAIYDCEYWNYAETGKDRVVLTKDGQRKEIRMKKNAISIDGVKHKTSVLTSKFLPDYPAKDGMAFDGTWLDSEQEATLRVVHRSGMAGIRTITNFHNIVKKDVKSYAAISDSIGRYEAHVPLVAQTGSMLFTNATQNIYHQGNWVWIPYVIGPGDKILFFVDDIEGRIYVMGKTARMTNEFLNYPMYGYSMDYDERKQLDFATFINKYNDEERLLLQHRDSVLVAHPLLSKRYKDYTAGIMMSFFAHDLGQLRFNRGKVKREEVLGEAVRRDLFNIDVPYMVLERYDFFLDDISDAAIQDYCRIGSGVPFLHHILQKARDGRLKLSNDEISLIQSELPAEEAIEIPRQELLDSVGIWIEGFYLTDTLNAMFGSRPELFNEILAYYQQRRLAALDSLDLPPLLREIVIARMMTDKITHDVKPMEDYQLQILRENVHQPYLLSEVLKFNDQLIAACKAAEAIVTPDPRPLADLTEGEDIFNKIVEPYRGRYIYLDVWGTWCAPCKQMMTFVPQMKEQLKDLDIVYLYLCNRSSEESWKTAISQFHLTGENCIHYNLPDNQQSALERYIGVGGYPTYKIVMPNGKLLPTQAPRPDHPEAIRKMIEETKSNK